MLALDWTTDFWIPFGFEALGAVLVVVPLYVAWRASRQTTRSRANFAIDQFDYTINWAAGHLELAQPLPSELRRVLQGYAASLRAAFAQDSLQIHRRLTTPAGHDGTVDDPIKLVHLLFARLEVGLEKAEPEPDDFLCGKAVSAYLKAVLSLHNRGSDQDLQTLAAVYRAAERQPGREVLFLVKSLIDAGPSDLRDRVLRAG